MSTQTGETGQRRGALSRELVLQTAFRLADRGGLQSVSMRKLGQELEIDLPAADGNWKAAMRRRAISLRDVLLRHRWAIGLMESRRNGGPANLRHHDAVIGSLRAGGMDVEMTAHAYSLLDSYTYGFALTKMTLPFDTGEEVAEVATGMLAPLLPDEYPHLVEMISHAMEPGYDYLDEFEYGLDAILDSLEIALSSSRG